MKLLSCVLLLGLLACARDVPTRVDRQDLGIAITFPAAPRPARYEDDSPFGRMDWYGSHCLLGARADLAFHVQVGNVPEGPSSPRTVPQAVEAYERWLSRRLSALQVTALGAEQGPGFTYRGKTESGIHVGGTVVVRRGRVHHAQGSVQDPQDPRLKAFLDSFKVY